MDLVFTENWFHIESQEALTDLYRQVSDLTGDVVEVGCWEGRSTLALAAACYPENVHAVDTWMGSPSDESGRLAKQRDVYATFLHNIAGRNIVAHQANWSEYFTQNWSPVKFCHIDGNHTYKEVRGNLEAVLPLLVPGGMLVGDDIHHPPVAQAVVDTLGETDQRASLWYWRHP